MQTAGKEGFLGGVADGGRSKEIASVKDAWLKGWRWRLAALRSALGADQQAGDVVVPAGFLSCIHQARTKLFETEIG